MHNALKLLFIPLVLFSYISSADIVDDKYLAQYLQEHNEGVIYLWSPGMPLSLVGLKEAELVAKDLNVSFLAVSDKDSKRFLVNESGYSGVFKKSLDMPLNSYQLSKKGIYDHFPAMAFFKNGKILKNIIHGYEKKVGVKAYLNSYLDLKGRK
jgi:hypothetical protein